MPGDMLEIRIDKIVPGADWGYNVIRPLAGTLPEDFHETTLMHIPVDRERLVCTMPWGTELAMAPFFGVMGVAPPPEFGTIASKEPRIHGGNLDNKELTAGSSLFLPVWVPGANFSVGDGHGVQGDGEVCVTALEMCLTGTLTFILHKGGGAEDAAGGNADALHQHGHERGPGSGDETGAARNDRVHLLAVEPVAGAGLFVLLAGGGFPCHPVGEWRKRRAWDAEEGAAVLMRGMMMIKETEPARMTAAEASSLIQARKLSCEELVRSCLRRIAAPRCGCEGVALPRSGLCHSPSAGTGQDAAEGTVARDSLGREGRDRYGGVSDDAELADL